MDLKFMYYDMDASIADCGLFSIPYCERRCGMFVVGFGLFILVAKVAGLW